MRKKQNNALSGQELLELIVKKIVWLLFAAIMTVLSYFTQIRPFIIANCGEYVMGVADGGLLTISMITLALWLLSQRLPEPNKK